MSNKQTFLFFGVMTILAAICVGCTRTKPTDYTDIPEPPLVSTTPDITDTPEPTDEPDITPTDVTTPTPSPILKYNIPAEDEFHNPANYQAVNDAEYDKLNFKSAEEAEFFYSDMQILLIKEEDSWVDNQGNKYISTAFADWLDTEVPSIVIDNDEIEYAMIGYDIENSLLIVIDTRLVSAIENAKNKLH